MSQASLADPDPAASELPDIYVDPRIPADAYRPTFVKSLAVVPIRQHDPLGAIGACWARTHEATPHEVALLQALANATAVASANVELRLLPSAASAVSASTASSSARPSIWCAWSTTCSAAAASSSCACRRCPGPA